MKNPMQNGVYYLPKSDRLALVQDSRVEWLMNKSSNDLSTGYVATLWLEGRRFYNAIFSENRLSKNQVFLGEFK